MSKETVTGRVLSISLNPNGDLEFEVLPDGIDPDANDGADFYIQRRYFSLTPHEAKLSDDVCVGDIVKWTHEEVIRDRVKLSVPAGLAL